jgi:hypothetical protein
MHTRSSFLLALLEKGQQLLKLGQLGRVDKLLRERLLERETLTLHFSTIVCASWGIFVEFDNALPRWILPRVIRAGKSILHFLALLSLAMHGVAAVAQDHRLNFIVDNERAFSRMHINTAAETKSNRFK